MKEIGNSNIGLVMAYVLPGFMALVGWLSTPPGRPGGLPTVGGFMFVTLASIGLGLAVSATRFVFLDPIYGLLGLRRPVWDDRRLQANLDAYHTLIAIHYNYYRFYANTIVAILFAYAVRRVSLAGSGFPDWTEPTVLGLVLIFGVTAYDNLRNYYRRADRLLGHPQSETDMSNGGHHRKETEPRSSKASGTTATQKPAEQREKAAAKRAQPDPGRRKD